MGAGKHASDGATGYDFSGTNNIKKSISAIKVLIAVTGLVVIVGGAFAIKTIIDNKKQKEPEVEPVSSVVSTLLEQYEGYDVLGKIVIDKINVEQYILDSSEDNALQKGVTKLYGGKLNDYGNFCIAGHNYENVFLKLSELEVGDTFKIVDKNLEETEYKIKDITSVEPDNLECLIPNDDIIEITLVTCENAGTTRLVVKAEKNDKTVEESKIEENSEENV